METIIESNGYKITFNGGKTYFVTDSANQCRLATQSFGKANKFFHNLILLSCKPLEK